MFNKKYEPTEQEKNTINKLSELSYDALNSVRSVLHSAAIKKGNAHSSLVYDLLSQVTNVVKIESQKLIKFDKVMVPDDYSQKYGYTVDVYVETNDTIFLIDPKGEGHNNNTPISDETKKWVLAKEQINITNPTKKVKFILLKPNDVDNNEFKRLKKSYNNYGIELYITDDFLTTFTKTEVNVSEILRQKKHKLMCESLINLCNFGS
jgi:hypothetical protein